MDLTKIKSAILNQLTDTNSLYSLKLQNHIYGCFIIMEDLAQGGVTLSDTILSTTKYKFDLVKHFHMIGIRFGFIMDTQLLLDKFNSDYQDTWIEIFKHVYLTKDLVLVDKMEDCIIELVETTFVRPQDDAFFLHALETGSLPQEWIEKVLNLIRPMGILNAHWPPAAEPSEGICRVGAKPHTLPVSNDQRSNIDENKPVITNTSSTAITAVHAVIDSYLTNMPTEKADSDEEVTVSAITKALVEKPVIRTRRRLTTTRRTHVKTDTKKKTRRHTAK